MKEIKLIKVGEHYDLYHRIAEEDLIIGFASTDNTFVNKLSLENCQAIERGYDLDELVKSECKNSSYNDLNHLVERGFKAGFQKALEILGDKKFTEKDMEEAFSDGQLNQLHNQKYFSGSKAYIQSLQQTEWDVEIVMDICGDKVYAVPEPKLDADGCIILKRKI
jgi:hypothetical protein